MLHTTFTVCSTAALQVAALHAAVFWLNLTHFNCMHPAPAPLQPTSYNTTPVHPRQQQQTFYFTPIYTFPWTNQYQYQSDQILLAGFHLSGEIVPGRSTQSSAFTSTEQEARYKVSVSFDRWDVFTVHSLGVFRLRLLHPGFYIYPAWH